MRKEFPCHAGRYCQAWSMLTRMLFSECCGDERSIAPAIEPTVSGPGARRCTQPRRASRPKTFTTPRAWLSWQWRAAGEVGLRIALLRVAYARSGFQTETNPKQARFIESDSEVYLKNVESLVSVRSPTVREGQLANDGLPNGRASDTAWIGLAPHS